MKNNDNKTATNGKGRKLRSLEWFNNPHNPGMTALYLERYLNYGLTRRGIAVRQADHRHRPDRQRPVAVQPPPSRTGAPGARRHPRGRRHRDGISDASDPGNRQAADRGARPQPRLSRPGRNPVRLSARRRGADHRLRQDHAGLPDGGGDRQYARHRAVGRPDAERLASRASAPAPAPWSGRRANELAAGEIDYERVHEYRGVLGARRSATATPWAPPRP